MHWAMPSTHPRQSDGQVGGVTAFIYRWHGVPPRSRSGPRPRSPPVLGYRTMPSWVSAGDLCLRRYFGGSPATGRPRQMRNPSRESE